MSTSKRRERLRQKKKNQWGMVKAALVKAFDRAVHRAFEIHESRITNHGL